MLDDIGYRPPARKTLTSQLDKFKLTFGPCGLSVRVSLSTGVDVAHPMVINNVSIWVNDANHDEVSSCYGCSQLDVCLLCLLSPCLKIVKADWSQ